MIFAGSHLSSGKGYEAMGRHALKLGEDTFAFFTRNPRGGRAKDIDPKDAAALRKLTAEHSFGTLVAHAPYTMNLCSAKEDVRKFGLEMIRDDLVRMEMTPHSYYNFHPGSHTGQGAETGIRQIAEALNLVLRPDQTTTVLLETMAGKGTEVGRSFQELREIIDQVELQEKLGVCLDRVIGLDRLKAVHFNDSMNPRGSRKDRHQKLGQGEIGMEAMRRIALHPALQGLPFILETPNDDAGYAAEIQTMRSWFA